MLLLVSDCDETTNALRDIYLVLYSNSVVCASAQTYQVRYIILVHSLLWLDEMDHAFLECSMAQ